MYVHAKMLTLRVHVSRSLVITPLEVTPGFAASLLRQKVRLLDQAQTKTGSLLSNGIFRFWAPCWVDESTAGPARLVIAIGFVLPAHLPGSVH